MAYLITHNQSRIYYARSGKQGAQPLVFIHGFTCDSSHWQTQVAHFEAEYDVICLDLGGHGRSHSEVDFCSITAYADDVITLIKTLAIERPILVGHSMGCRVSICVASQYQAVAGLVLIDAGAAVEKDQLEAVLSGVHDLVNNVGYADFMKMMFEAMFIDDNHEQLKQAVTQQAMNFSPEIGMKLGTSMMKWEAEEQNAALEKIHVPILGICATVLGLYFTREPVEKDVYDDWAKMMMAKTPQIDVVNMLDTGHFVMQERPQELNRLLQDFVEQVLAVAS